MPHILNQFGRPIVREHPRPHWRRLLAKYDAAQTTDDNLPHWANADSLSADSANSPEVRPKLRNRARYEAANNSYCRGMVDTLAVLAAAETAADFAAVIQTKNPPDAGYEPAGTTSGYAAPEPMDVFELAQRLVTVLPDGYELGQIRAEQPSTTYGEFKREILAEAFAAIVMPYNVGAHDSSEFNSASGKLDRLTYSRAVGIEQSDWEIDCLERVFWAWYDEAALIPGYLPDGLPPAAEWIVTLYWDGLEDIDPEKAAKSAEVRLRSGQTSYPALYAAAGLDYETEMSKQAAALGMSLEEYRRRLADGLLGPSGSTESRSETDATAEAT